MRIACTRVVAPEALTGAYVKRVADQVRWSGIKRRVCQRFGVARKQRGEGCEHFDARLLQSANRLESACDGLTMGLV